MPTANNHSCVLKPAIAGAKIRTEKGAAKIAGKPVDHIYQIAGGKSSLKSVHFPRADGWGTSAATEQAREWCSGQNGSFEPMSKKDEAEAANEADALHAELAEAATLEDCEDIRQRLVSLCPVQDRENDLADILQEADDKIDALKHEGREELTDSFEAPAKIVDRLVDGRLRVRAIIGQVDKINKNQRLYPKDEASDWIEKANRTAKRGGLLGLDGHPSLFGGGGTARDVVVRWEKLMLNENDIWAEGLTVPTKAFAEGVGPCWESDVTLEWSKRGWGKREEVENDKSEWSHDIIHDYILDGVDVVLRGADKTRTVSLTVEHIEEPPAQDGAPEGATTMPDEITTDETPKDEPKPEVKTELTVATLPPAPTVDVDAITNEVLEKAKAEREVTVTASAEASKAMFDKMVAEKALTDHKVKLLGTLAADDILRKPAERALVAAQTIEASDEVFAEYIAVAAERVHGRGIPTGIGMITEERHEKQRGQSMWLCDTLVDRPKSGHDAYAMLLESVASNGRSEWNDPKRVWAKVLENYQTIHPEYFEYCTPHGVLDAASTSAVLGTILPSVLPLLRELWEKLVVLQLTSVQPIDRPESTVYFYAPLTEAGASLSDSATWDSDFANRGAQATAKKQIKPSFTSQDISAFTKSIYFDLSTELEQDAKAVQGVDLDAELIMNASDEIARELNYGFLSMLLMGAGAGTVDFGTAVPTSSNYNGQEWRNVFGTFIEKARMLVSNETFIRPNWMVCDPNVALLAGSMNMGGIVRGDRVDFGTGLSFIGTLADSLRIYQATWFTPNTALFGYSPPSWAQTAHVYCPYVPLYVSQRDFSAALNTNQRSVSSRQGWKLLRAKGLSIIETTGDPGSEPI